MFRVVSRLGGLVCCAAIVSACANDAAVTPPPVEIVPVDSTAIHLALGDTVLDDMVGGIGQHHFELTVAPNDTVDLVVVSLTPGSLPNLQMRALAPSAPLPSVLFGYPSFYAAMVAPKSGRIRFEAYDPTGCSSRCWNTGRYLVRTRRSDALLRISTPYAFHVMEGREYPETSWVHNFGARPGTVGMIASVPWLTMQPATGTTIPALDSVAFIARARPGSLSTGSYPTDVTIATPPSIWNYYAPPRWPLLMMVDDSTARIVNRTTKMFGLRAGPGGTLFGWTGSELSSIDPASGAVRLRRTVADGEVRDLDFAPDGTQYITARTQYDGDIIFSLRPDGTPNILMKLESTITGTAVLPDGRIYATHNGILSRRNLDGSVDSLENVGTVSANQTNLVYHPLDGGLYYSDRSRVLHRYDPATGVDETRGGPQEGNLDIPIIAVDRFGRLYARTLGYNTQYVLVIDTGGHVVGRIYPPGTSDGLAVVGDVLFGADYYPGQLIWRATIP